MGLEVGAGFKVNPGQIKVCESWMRLLLLTSEMERLSDTARHVTIFGNTYCF